MIQMIRLKITPLFPITNVMLHQTDHLHIQVNFQDDAEYDYTYVHPVGITTFPTNRGGNPMPEVTGYLDDVVQLDVDTIIIIIITIIIIIITIIINIISINISIIIIGAATLCLR